MKRPQMLLELRKYKYTGTGINITLDQNFPLNILNSSHWHWPVGVGIKLTDDCIQLDLTCCSQVHVNRNWN